MSSLECKMFVVTGVGEHLVVGDVVTEVILYVSNRYAGRFDDVPSHLKPYFVCV